ncbi:voltage-dependent calcium channel subunit alpha-2/delta-1 isoform X1 [Cherax quadricarinatus]|uniref:voltage-dependent calcium channel subunit alpha-2/delta-1 isoform X1 n=1 Tax=Cherax quadricarinatus TaxID=27406 RepID=UPI00387E35E0
MARGVAPPPIYLFIFIVTCISASRVLSLDAKSFHQVSNDIERWINELHSRTSHAHLLKKDLSDEVGVSIEPVYPQELVKKMARDISSLLKSKRNALQRIVENLQDGAGSYVWSDELRLNTSHPLLMKDLDPDNASHEMTYDERFGVPVRYNFSGIHVPLEVYEGYPEILNGLSWSSSVDWVFQDNYERDPTLSWQYFGAQTGFMRVYPATSWYVPPNLIDLYDARLRPWYVQGSVSPKDMIILMDRSGSVHGQTFTIMKWAVKTLIDTLGENDFVNVAAFNNTTQWVNNCTYCQVNKTTGNTSCTQALVQASTSNKKLLFHAIDELTDGGMASYSNALNFAFNAFKQFEGTKKEGEGASCHKTIMLFSDGGTEWPQEVFNKFQADNYTKSVRIFTYAVGPHPIPTAVLKQMACSTGGKYSVITTRSSVRTKIQESYTSLLYPAQPLNGNHIDQYTTAYTSAVTEELTVSLTRPVYNTSYYSNTSTLAGVAGIDIPIQTLKNLSPFEALGPNGYAFIINHNGFLVLHPRLCKQLSYLLGPPHIDLLDVEEDIQKTNLIRTNMIRGKIENVQVLGKIRVDEAHRVLYDGIQFSYSPVPNTSYSLALINLKRSEHLVIHDQDTTMMTPPNVSTTVIAPWPYCRGQQHRSHDDHLITLIRDIQNKKRTCRDDLVQGLLWSQTWTQPLLDKWISDRSLSDIIGRVIFTRFGLARFYPESQKPGVNRWHDPWYNSALRRAELNRKVSVIPHSLGAVLSAPVIVQKNGDEVMAAAVAVNLTANFLHRGFVEQLQNKEWWDQNEYLVLLLDDGGLIITSNRELMHGITLQGMFIGDLDIPILKHLKDSRLYDVEVEVDKQAICKELKHNETSAGPRSSHIPSPLSFVASILIEVFSWAEYLKYLLYSGVLAIITPSVEAWSEWGMTQIGGMESCRMERAIYYFGETKTLSGILKCNNYSAKFWAERLQDTNAMLIAIEMSANVQECGVYSNLPGIQPKRVTSQEPCAYQDRYRKRLISCLTSNSMNDVGCNGCPNHLEVSLAHVLLTVAVCSNFINKSFSL